MIFHQIFKTRVGLRPVGQHVDLQNRERNDIGDAETGELAEDELREGPALEPPVGGDAFAVPPRLIGRVAVRGHERIDLPPEGRSIDLKHWVEAVNLYCWMAPAGSTWLGQNSVHSPTKV